MINIYINNQLADYFGDLTIKKDNPLFSNFDVEPTEHTYTLTLPTTATNAKIFSLIQYTLATPQKLPARIEVDGVQVLEGSCNVQSWNDSGYNVYFSGVIPYEDIADNSIKKMLADNEFIKNRLSFGSVMSENGDNAGIVKEGMIIGRAYAYIGGENTELITTNVAFSLSLLMQSIANYYGITIQPLDEFTNHYVVCAGRPFVRNENFEGRPVFFVDVDESLPRIRAKVLIESVASAFGYKVKIDYLNNAISFYSLDDFSKLAVAVSHSKYNVEFNQDIPVVGKFNFAQYDAFEISTDEGKKEYPYTTLNNIEISKGTAKYSNKLSIMQMSDKGIILPRDREEDADKELIALCTIASTTTYLLTINSYTLPYFELYKKVGGQKTIIKLSAHINPLQFKNLDMWSPIYIDNVGNVFVKSLSFKSNGESDIEAYLY